MRCDIKSEKRILKVVKCENCGSKLRLDNNNGYSCYITYCPICDKEMENK